MVLISNKKLGLIFIKSGLKLLESNILQESITYTNRPHTDLLAFITLFTNIV